MEEEAEETVEEEGMPLPNEEGVRLGSCTEEWYTGSAEERGRGRATERGLPSDSLRDSSERRTTRQIKRSTLFTNHIVSVISFT